MKMCFNWKVIAGLAVVGLGTWVVAPNLVGPALPLLFLAACPLPMLVMMWGMRGMQGNQCATRPEQVNQTARDGRTREEHVAELRAQLVDVQARQEAIARELAQLDFAEEGAVVREAEAVAREVNERGRTPP